MHGIAFSAAYQMVARFANKNTISLGLGCVGSGLLALGLELVLSVGPKPTRTSFIILFEVAAGADYCNRCLHFALQTYSVFEFSAFDSVVQMCFLHQLMPCACKAYCMVILSLSLHCLVKLEHGSSNSTAALTCSHNATAAKLSNSTQLNASACCVAKSQHYALALHA